MSDLSVAKVFMSGRSQAVRLPKEFRFDADEVTVERSGDALILRPRLSKDAWWAQMEAILGGFEGMEFVERDRTPPRDDIASFD